MAKPGARTLGFSRKIIVSFSVLCFFFFLSFGYILYDIHGVRLLADTVINKRQPIADTARQALERTGDAVNALHQYSLTGEPRYYNIFIRELDIVQTKINQIHDSDIVSATISHSDIHRISKLIRTLYKKGQQLKALQNDYEANHPVIAAASKQLNPLALEYLGLINQIIDDIYYESDSLDRTVKLKLLNDLRYSWIQIMSHIRIAIATRNKRDMKNVRSYIAINKSITKKIDNMQLDFGVFNIEELHDLFKQYEKAMNDLAMTFDGKIYNKSVQLMIKEIIPTSDELESKIDIIVSEQSSTLSSLLDLFLRKIDNAEKNYILIILALAVFAAILATMLVRLINHRLLTLTTAAEKVSQGKLETRLDVSETDELGQLAHCFNDMLENIDKSHTELTLAKENAEKASQAKTLFLSHMSHELRTPLNSILGYTQLLEMEEKKPFGDRNTALYKESIQYILDSGWHLLNLVNELLDLSNIEADVITITRSPMPLESVLNDCLNAVRQSATDKHHELSASISTCQDTVINVDEKRFRQVILNLLNNAIKYTEASGKIELRCEQPVPEQVKIIIEDNGYGINEELLSSIFKPFQRVHGHKHGIDGVGIGLSLCQRIVTLMDGEIGVESTPDVGSKFWITFPVSNTTL